MRLARIVGIAALGAVPGFLEDGFAGRTDTERGKIGLLRRVLQREHVAFLLAALGGLRGRGELRVAQAASALLSVVT